MVTVWWLFVDTVTGGDVDLPAVGTDTLVGIVAVVVVAYLLARVSSIVLTRLSERFRTRRIAIRMAIPIITFGIYLSAAFVIANSLLELTTAQVLAFSGLLGAAIGFGLRDLFTGVVGGIAIILERPYRVGDKVEITGHYGEVVDVGLRATRLQTHDDDLVSVPNDTFFSEPVANANAGNQEVMVVTEFVVAHDTNVERAREIIEEAVVTSRYIYITDECPYSVSIRDRPYYYLLRVRAYANDHRHERALVSDITPRIHAQFKQEGIEKPRRPVVDDHEN